AARCGPSAPIASTAGRAWCSAVRSVLTSRSWLRPLQPPASSISPATGGWRCPAPADRPVLSGGSTALLWRPGAGRIVGSVTTRARRNSPFARTYGGDDHGTSRTVRRPDGPPFVPAEGGGCRSRRHRREPLAERPAS